MAKNGQKGYIDSVSESEASLFSIKESTQDNDQKYIGKTKNLTLLINELVNQNNDLINKNNDFKDQNNNLANQNNDLKNQRDNLESQNEILCEELRLLRLKLYAGISERFELDDKSIQMMLFPSLFSNETEVKPDAEKDFIEIKGHKRKKSNDKKLPEDLERIER